jgi:predicted metal-binding membrane protein
MLKIRALWIGRDRLTFLAGAAAVTALAWLYVVQTALPLGPAGHTHPHTSAYFGTAFVMWIMMMIAMMLPSTLPFVFAFGAEHRRRRAHNLPHVAAGVFLAGYFALWTGFSAAAAALQLALHRGAWLSAAMSVRNSVFAGAILGAAGIYQWTPFKEACLRHCRSPLSFLLSDWREGRWGVFTMGLEHGLFCLGCCWLIMLLPFAGGVMSLGWMAAITAFILIEKAAPGGPLLGRIAGVALVGAGIWMMAA